MTRLALPLAAVLTLHASPRELGLLGAVTYAPFLLLGLPAGLCVDRRRRRPILVAADLGQLVAIGAIPLLAALDQLTLGRLLAAAFVAGGMQVFFELAYRAYLPSVVPTDALTSANAKLTMSESAAEIAGPGLGGLLVQLIGAPYALLVDATSYLFSAAGLTAIRGQEQAPPRDPSSLRKQLADGIRFTVANPYLRAFAGEAASYNLCWQVVQTVLVLFAVRTLGLSPAALGAVLAVGGLGALLGAAWTRRAAQRFGLGKTLIAAAVIADLSPLVVPFVPSGSVAAPLLGVTFFVRGLGVTGCNVHVTAIRQTITPDHLLGRTNSVYRMVVYGVVPVGALLGGWLGSTIGLRATLAIGTGGLITSALFLICSPVRHARSLSDCT